jgi:MFS family permease
LGAVIVLGILVVSVFYFGIAFVTWFPLMIVVALLAGLGDALILPALSAFYLDITSERHRSQIMGVKESAVHLGGVAGPLAMVGVGAVFAPRGIFIGAGILVAGTAVLALVFLRSPRRADEGTQDIRWDISDQRCMAAQATLRGVVVRAKARREAHAMG